MADIPAALPRGFKPGLGGVGLSFRQTKTYTGNSDGGPFYVVYNKGGETNLAGWWDAISNIFIETDTDPQFRLSRTSRGAMGEFGIDGFAFHQAQSLSAAIGRQWEANIVHAATAVVYPTTPNGHVYYTLAGGTTGAVEPTWNIGSNTTDNTVTWVDGGTYAAFGLPEAMNLITGYADAYATGVSIPLFGVKYSGAATGNLALAVAQYGGILLGAPFALLASSALVNGQTYEYPAQTAANARKKYIRKDSAGTVTTGAYAEVNEGVQYVTDFDQVVRANQQLICQDYLSVGSGYVMDVKSGGVVIASPPVRAFTGFRSFIDASGGVVEALPAHG